MVADIGGTNTRLAFAPPGETTLVQLRSFRNAEFASFEDLISVFLPDNAVLIDDFVVAMAGRVVGNSGRMTNLDWVIDGKALSERLGGTNVHVINDLTALGHATLQLKRGQLIPIVDQSAETSNQRQALVVGIGTGFNVSPVVETTSRFVCPAVEAGHTSLYASITAELDRLKPGLSHCFNTVEALFSGRGRQKFLSQLTGENVDSVTPYISNKGQAHFETTSMLGPFVLNFGSYPHHSTRHSSRSRCC
jgi:glucokinase